MEEKTSEKVGSFVSSAVNKMINMVMVVIIIALVLLVAWFWHQNELLKQRVTDLQDRVKSFQEMNGEDNDLGMNKTKSQTSNKKETVCERELVCNDYKVFSKKEDVSFLLEEEDLKMYTPTTMEVEKALRVSAFYLSHNKVNVKDVSEYKVQIVGGVNGDGEKIMLMSYFCSLEDEYFNKGLAVVEDGGNCFFKLKVNLDTNKVSNIRINGDA